MLRIALAQINTTVGDLDGNIYKILKAVSHAKQKGADLVVFPECAVTGYPPEDLLLKDHFVRDNIGALKRIAKKITGLCAVIGFVDMDKKNRRIFNAAAVISGGRVKEAYHKHQLPNYGVFDEKRYFSEGEDSPVFLIGGVPVGISICEDIWSDCGIFISQKKAGARVLINISASPYDAGKLMIRERLLSLRAKQTGAYVCYCNLIGGQDELVFDGGSLIIGPNGRMLAHAKQFEEDLLIFDLPVEPVRMTRRHSKQFFVLSKSLSDHAGHALPKQEAKRYSVLERIHRALILGTRDYIQKNGFKKAVIGLSGGIDSSVVAAIAVEAIGKENVVGISMPSQFTSAGTRSDACELAKKLGIRFIEKPIDPIFNSYLNELKAEFSSLPPDIAEENLQARIRGNLLMAFSNKFGWLVLTTGNKSEVAVGYCTLYGDMTGGFAVIKDVPKTLVYEIAALINQTMGPVIPPTVISRAPSAELRENQTDQDSLPPYDRLDLLLKAYVEEHQSLSKMKKKDPDLVMIKKVVTLIDRSEYKRRQSPPGIKISPRAFGKDWRLPITNKYKEF